MLEEIQDYWNRRSKTYSEENLEELQSHKAQKWKNIFTKFAPKPLDQIKVLDIGCGPGIFSIILSELGACVSALDYTPKMLEHAKKNVTKKGVNIEFLQGDAQNLPFKEACFDMVVSRNLTWNLSHPKRAYQEWYRVLKKDGRMLNFDANWYLYLYDEKQRKDYLRDREKVAKLGLPDLMTNAYPNAEKMEEIAKNLVLSKMQRPQWDAEVLSSIGFEMLVCNEEFYREVWDEKEQLMFAFAPLFSIIAQK